MHERKLRRQEEASARRAARVYFRIIPGSFAVFRVPIMLTLPLATDEDGSDVFGSKCCQTKCLKERFWSRRTTPATLGSEGSVAPEKAKPNVDPCGSTARACVRRERRRRIRDAQSAFLFIQLTGGPTGQQHQQAQRPLSPRRAASYVFPARKSPTAFFLGLLASFCNTPDDGSMRSMLPFARPEQQTARAGKIVLVRGTDDTKI